jgi:hypothetical protein
MFRLERIERVPSRPSCPAVAGKIFHTASETIDQQLHEGNDARDSLIQLGMKAVADCYDQQIEDDSKHFTPDEWRKYGRPTKEKPNAEDMDWFLAKGIPNMVTAYVDWRLTTGWKLAEIPGFGPAIEVPFNHYVDGVLVHGWIDRIFEVDDQYTVVDLKTGQKPKTDEQLGLYNAALNKGLGWSARWGYYVYGLKTGEAKMTAPLDLQHWSDEKLALVMKPAQQQIVSQIFIPNPGDACFHCGVNYSCDFARSAI